MKLKSNTRVIHVEGDENTSLMDLSKRVTPLQSVASWAYACMHPDEYVPLPTRMHTQGLLSLSLLSSDTLCVTPPGVDERVSCEKLVCATRCDYADRRERRCGEKLNWLWPLSQE